MSEAEPKADFSPGLAGVPAAKSSVCYLDGRVGKLQYRGYSIEVLAEHCTFEEVTYLLLFAHLPTRTELAAFIDELAGHRAVKFRVKDVLKLLPESGHPMEALTSAVAALAMFYPGDHVTDRDERRATALRLIAKLPTILAAWHRIRVGDDPIEPRRDLGHAANFLYMLSGVEPDPLVAHVFDVALILHAEHQMNASTFAARVVGSTLADPYAVVAAAISALAGPLHGGANEEVLGMLERVPSQPPSAVRAWAEDRLAKKAKIAGFGHREYKVKDPRATILQGLASKLFDRFGRTPIYDVAVQLEKQMGELVGPKGVYPNVDFYSGIVYQKMGIPTDLFTPVFAIARVAGWLAHLLEQLEDNRIFRPSQIWVGGEHDRSFVPIDQR
jgi:citrate synthase